MLGGGGLNSQENFCVIVENCSKTSENTNRASLHNYSKDNACYSQNFNKNTSKKYYFEAKNQAKEADFNTYKQNTTAQQLPRTKLFALIIALIFAFSAILTSGIVLLNNYASKATTGSSSLPNLYNTDGTINPSAAGKILNAVGYLNHKNDTGTYTAHNIAGRTNDNSGATIIFPMGYYVSKAGVMDITKPIYWQAVYLNNGYLTVWMNNNYTIDSYNWGSTTSSGWGNGISYNEYGNYSKSTLRDITKNIYSALTSKLTDFNTLIKAPSEINAEWQTIEQEDVYTSSSGFSHHNNLYYSSTSSYGGSYTGWSHTLWSSEDQPYSDKFWIPSSAEVFNNVSGSSNQSDDNGLWGLTVNDRVFKSSNTSEVVTEPQTTIDGNNTASDCWLRSAGSRDFNTYPGIQVKLTGSAVSSAVGNTSGIRPAAHISLSKLLEYAGYNISTILTNVTADLQEVFYIPQTNIAQTFTFTPNINYYINLIRIGATDGSLAQISVAINNIEPNYSTITNLCKYKVYREGNTVKVVVNEVLNHITIVCNTSNTMTISTGSNISNLSLNRDTMLNTTATVSATYANGYYPQFSYNSSTPVKASGSAGKGGFGSVQYSYTFTNNIFKITFTNLPTGADNIPTLNLTAYTLDSFGITVNAPNCVYEIIYEDTQTIINVTPNAGYYVTQAHTNSNAAENIKYYRGYLRVTDNAYAISYMASDYSAKVKFIIYDLSGNLTLNIITQNTKPVLEESGGTKIDGVAIQARLSGSGDVLACLGDVRLMGYTTTSGLDYVHISATESKGYRFDYWEIDGTALDISTYGISADVPLDMVLGKVIVAVYTATNNNLNYDINTPDNGGLV